MGLGGFIVDFITNPFWTASDRLVYFNFGMAYLKRKADDIEISIEIIDIHNVTRISKSFSLKKDLNFNR